jgi:putative DNA methylase
MLEGLLQTGFQITGTWPVRTELTGNLKKKLNVLASSIVLACRPRPVEASPATRQEFVRALRRELPDALSVMMAENVAPVDLAQATIGPGMAIYSRYSKVIEADGSPMRVRTALQIINQSLDEHLSEAEGEVDPYTRFALTWFEQRGMQDGPYGEAESVATARNVSVRGVQDAGILEARAGKVRLLPRESLFEDWDPATDERLTDPERAFVITVCDRSPELTTVRTLATEFRRMLHAHDVNALTPWLAAAEQSELKSFTQGLRRDRDAVLAAVCFRWSNGPVEGQVNRLKLVKRTMYGRASFALLRRRVLAA